MGASLAVLGLVRKSNKKNKVYYVNRKYYAFSLPVVGPDGKPVYRMNQATGQPMYNGRGEPEIIERTVQFKEWHGRFREEGYWCVYEVTAETDKIIAEELERQANSPQYEVMTEKAFIEKTNPDLGTRMAEDEAKDAEIESLKRRYDEKEKESNKQSEEIARLRQRAGIK